MRLFSMGKLERHILAMGGGGFSDDLENMKLDHYLLSLSNQECPKVCFIPTATGDSERYINRFHDAFKKLNFECVLTFNSKAYKALST